MALTSPRFSWNLRLQSAYNNSPAMGRGESGEAVRLIQQALIDLGFPMPRSTKRYGSPDGIYGSETHDKVWAFQKTQSMHGLKPDGVVGKNTLTRLNVLLPNRAPRLPPLPAALLYHVPGLIPAIPQPTDQVCWATAYAIMRSWRDSVSYPIRDAVDLVGSTYSAMFDANRPLPTHQFGPFIQAAGLRLQPMANLPLSGWLDLLRAYGPLWVGALNAVGPGAGLHSRIVRGIRGDGSYGATWMKIVDPAGGREYQESYGRFWHLYENAITGVSGTYFQIRHF